MKPQPPRADVFYFANNETGKALAERVAHDHRADGKLVLETELVLDGTPLIELKVIGKRDGEGASAQAVKAQRR